MTQEQLIYSHTGQHVATVHAPEFAKLFGAAESMRDALSDLVTATTKPGHPNLSEKIIKAQRALELCK